MENLHLQNILNEMPSNVCFFCAFFAWCTAQLIKLIIDFSKTRKIDLHYFLSTGGWPSAHSATVTSLAVSIGLVQGFDTPLFAFVCAYAIITMFDACTLRLDSGKNAAAINALIKDLNKEEKFPKLKEKQGHTINEVWGGFLWGLFFSLVFVFVWNKISPIPAA